jgi:hypothetical protein
MKLSVALSLFLASASAVAAFQAPSTTSRRIGSLNAVAIDPTTLPVAPRQDKKERVEIDMTGVALSVRHADVVEDQIKIHPSIHIMYFWSETLAVSRSDPYCSQQQALVVSPLSTNLYFSFSVFILLLQIIQGLNGQALKWQNSDFPEARELRAVIPAECFEVDTAKSLGYLSVSVVGTALVTFIGANLLSVLPPENLLTLPFWTAYSAVAGTVAMGLWVLAHECGHGAFSKNKTIQDTVGYVLHSLFLVPYYSWQRSHAVHHQYTNHMELGETHVPEPVENIEEGSVSQRNGLMAQFGGTLGVRMWGVLQAFLHLIVGWPAYLLIGATGGTDRGMTNHYWPDPLTTPNQPKKELFPGNWKQKVFKSDIGVAAVAASAIAWAACNGVPQMMALYGGPLIVVNAWLVIYTWYVCCFLFVLPRTTKSPVFFLSG